MNFRVRISFTLFIGPFIVLGSLIIVTRGQGVELDLSRIQPSIKWSAVATFMLLGFVAGGIEVQTWNQINRWRECIGKLVSGQRIGQDGLNEYLKDTVLTRRVVWYYGAVFSLIVLAFYATASIAAQVIR
jgi:hypothetical protein